MIKSNLHNLNLELLKIEKLFVKNLLVPVAISTNNHNNIYNKSALDKTSLNQIRAKLSV